MSKITKEMRIASTKNILPVLVEKTSEMTDQERAMWIYNNAIKDCYEYLENLIPHNPQFSLILGDMSSNLKMLKLVDFSEEGHKK